MSGQLAFRQEREEDVVVSLIELLSFSGGHLPELTADEVATLIAALQAYAALPAPPEPSLAQEHLF